MSTYITEDRNRYEVPDCKLKRAVTCIEDEYGVSCDVTPCRDGASVITAREELFGGDVANSWYKNVTEFMREFCLPGSYATFREDDEFSWSMAVLTDDGGVEWDEMAICNPFDGRCDELDARGSAGRV